jgi:cell division protein FtsI/penicillin-binding protein 2
MSEVFFILTTIFVAYVVFSVVNDEKKKAQKDVQTNKPVQSTKPATNEVKVAVPQTTSETKVTKPTVKKTPEVEPRSIRNPETGEIAKIPNNYRFSKRWIKEVLVKEGLLDKIYKNSELNDETNAKIKQALVELQAIEKYHP